MNGFFRGWKRKLGLACMALACLLTIEWMRSSISSRAYSFNPGGTRSHVIVTRDSQLFWIAPGKVRFPSIEFAVDLADLTLDLGADGFFFDLTQGTTRLPGRYSLKGELWLTYLIQQSGNKIQLNNLPLRVIAIPFWLITTPLIVLAMLLLLSRQPPQKSAREPDTQIGPPIDT